MKLNHIGSLITVIAEDGREECLGYLIDFKEHGVHSPNGKVEVTPEQAKIHNQLLAEGELQGLDNNCEVGMCGSFYLVGGNVTTFTGVTVAPAKVNGKSITFVRQGKTYRGRAQKDMDYFNFKRIK